MGKWDGNLHHIWQVKNCTFVNILSVTAEADVAGVTSVNHQNHSKNDGSTDDFMHKIIIIVCGLANLRWFFLGRAVGAALASPVENMSEMGSSEFTARAQPCSYSCSYQSRPRALLCMQRRQIKSSYARIPKPVSTGVGNVFVWVHSRTQGPSVF